MSEQAKVCLERAADCERRMLLVTDETARKTYRELADQWRAMADQAEELEKRQRPSPAYVRRSSGGGGAA